MSQGIKILYVDDEKGNIDYFRSVFRRRYEVITATSGEEGLKILKDDPDIAIILTDQRMPRMSGIEFLMESISINDEAIRVLVTGYADMETVISAINKGHIYFYISKPWTYDEMQIIISRALDTYELKRQNKQLLIVSERREKDKIVAQLESLKNQINPHFLFNSLNTLSALVSDNLEARSFVRKLSNIYRYLLDHRIENVVSLQEELKFLQDYLHLQNIRFKDAFTFDCRVDTNYYEHKIPTAALQLMVENTLKHNIATKEKPLHVDIFNDGDWIYVKNNFQPKTIKDESFGIGQTNLKQRFSILTEKKLEFSQIENHYVVKIPLMID
ncbi:MAG: histidine kinase [Cyclobacteriaceae bacterium]